MTAGEGVATALIALVIFSFLAFWIYTGYDYYQERPMVVRCIDEVNDNMGTGSTDSQDFQFRLKMACIEAFDTVEGVKQNGN